MLRNRLIFSALTIIAVLPISSCGGFVCFSTGSPQIVSIAPVTVVSGSSPVQVTIVGNNFSNGTVLILNDGTQLAPTSISSTRITVVFGAGFFNTVGTVHFHLLTGCNALSNTVVINIVQS